MWRTLFLILWRFLVRKSTTAGQSGRLSQSLHSAAKKSLGSQLAKDFTEPTTAFEAAFFSYLFLLALMLIAGFLISAATRLISYF